MRRSSRLLAFVAFLICGSFHVAYVKAQNSRGIATSPGTISPSSPSRPSVAPPSRSPSTAPSLSPPSPARTPAATPAARTPTAPAPAPSRAVVPPPAPRPTAPLALPSNAPATSKGIEDPETVLLAGLPPIDVNGLAPEKAEELAASLPALSPQQFELLVGTDALTVPAAQPSTAAQEAQLDKELGFAPAAATKRTSVSLTDLSALEANGSLAPALPPQLQIDSNQLATLASVPAEALSPSVLQAPAIANAVAAFERAVEQERPVAPAPAPSTNASVMEIVRSLDQLNKTGDLNAFISSAAAVLDPLAPSSSASLATAPAPAVIDTALILADSVPVSALSPATIAAFAQNNITTSSNGTVELPPAAPAFALAGSITTASTSISNFQNASAVLERAKRQFLREINAGVKRFTGSVPTLLTKPTSKFCSDVTRGMVASCKQGVRAQAATCKTQVRQQIDQCKQAVRESIDKCKKKRFSVSALCELRRPEVAKCETQRINVPLCELDRLSNACCEAQRPLISSQCRAGVSSNALQRQMDTIQASCAIATSIAKSALKSYASGAVLGFVSQIEEVKAVSDTIKAVESLEKKAKQLEAVGGSLISQAEKGVSSLSAVCSLTTGGVLGSACSTISKAESQLSRAFRAAAQLEAITTIKRTVDTLRTLGDNIQQIRQAANECSRMPPALRPEAFTGWSQVRNEQDFQREYANFQKSAVAAQAKVIQCQSVVIKIQQLQAI